MNYDDYTYDYLLNKTLNDTYYDSDYILPSEIHFWLNISTILWWYVVSIASLSLPFYGYAFYKLLRNDWKRHFFLLCIVITDTIMLTCMVSYLLIGKDSPRPLGPILCKVMVFTSNTATFFTNWCWVFIWGWQYISVFYPFRRLRVHERLDRSAMSAATLLAVAVLCELWTILYTTQYNIGGVTFCELNSSVEWHTSFKWLVLSESVVSYILPVMLVILADVSILWKSYIFTGEMSSVLIEDLGQSSQSDKPSQTKCPDSARIVSHKLKQTQLRRKQQAVIRCALIGSIDLLLNMPDYLVQTVDNFISLRSFINDFKVYYAIEAFAYVLFFFQFPMIIWYVHWLLKSQVRPSRRSTCGYSSLLHHNPEEMRKKTTGGSAMALEESKDKN